MTFSQAQMRVIKRMKDTGRPLVMRKGQDGVRRYSVDDKTITKKTAESLMSYLKGGGLETEAYGHIQVRRYTLPAEKSE